MHAQLLARRGILGNVRAFSIFGAFSEAAPARAPIDAVARGELDVAIVWGPLAGYFAQREKPALTVVPVLPSDDPVRLPMTFAIALGVRREDRALHQTLDGILERRKHAIDALLQRFGVPLVHDRGAS